jgi:5-methylcytosine-specific restriction endonuclease McrA
MALQKHYKDRYVERNCLNCGKPFISRSKLQRKYCSQICAQATWRIRIMMPKACLICGAALDVTSPRQKYCINCSKIEHKKKHKIYLKLHKTLSHYRFHNQNSAQVLETSKIMVPLKRPLKRVIQTRESNRRWRHRHPEDHRRCNAEWRRRNKDKVNFMNRRREHLIRGAAGYLTYEEWQEIKARFNYTCPQCGKKEPEIKLTIDHITPISKGGTNNKENIQPLCSRCNSAKWSKIILLQQPMEVT